MLWACLGLTATIAIVLGGGGGGGRVFAETAPPGTVAPMGPLIVVPAGCLAPAPALAVFTGTITALDDPVHPTTARLSIDRQLSGDLGAYLIAGETDVRYGPEARFLSVGGQYIVGVRADETTGRLVSAVREPAALFGGDAVIGLNDSDTACPRVEDPVRTLFADGTSVDSGLLSPLHGQGSAIVWSFLKPLLYALAGLIVLVLIKQALFAFARSLRDLRG